MSYSYSFAPDDFDQWAELHLLLMDSFAYMADRIDPPSSLLKMTPKTLQETAHKDTFLIVCNKGELIGCAWFQTRKDVIYVGKVAVAVAHRHQGISRKIFEMAAAFAQKQGKSHLELQTRVELIENHQLFERLGFVKTGEATHTGFDRATSITMQKGV